MGPARCLSGSRDITERILKAAAAFASDGGAETRLAKYLVNSKNLALKFPANLSTYCYNINNDSNNYSFSFFVFFSILPS